MKNLSTTLCNSFGPSPLLFKPNDLKLAARFVNHHSAPLLSESKFTGLKINQVNERKKKFQTHKNRKKMSVFCPQSFWQSYSTKVSARSFRLSPALIAQKPAAIPGDVSNRHSSGWQVAPRETKLHDREQRRQSRLAHASLQNRSLRLRAHRRSSRQHRRDHVHAKQTSPRDCQSGPFTRPRHRAGWDLASSPLRLRQHV